MDLWVDLRQVNMDTGAVAPYVRKPKTSLQITPILETVISVHITNYSLTYFIYFAFKNINK